MKIRIFRDQELLASAAAALFLGQYQRVIKKQSVFNVCLSGGSTPALTFEMLASRRFQAQVSWNKIHVFWTDERWVPPDSSESNYRLAWESLLKKVPIPAGNIHRFKTEFTTTKDVVSEYARELEGTSEFDFVFLGLGDDGHVASLFPDADLSPFENEKVFAVWVPHLNSFRFTLGFQVFNHAKLIILLVSGERKASIVKEILEKPKPSRPYPVQRIHPEKGELIWLLDTCAAQKLVRKKAA